ncbi:MAG: SDR family NAD(P)-dependent oxidoreductase, partial [Novosphingobium sp.]
MPNVLITGGARGIGRATAILAAERGWSVAINYNSDEEAAHDTRTVVEGRGQRGIVVQGDVADEQQVIAMFDQATSELGGLDAVVVNAGIVALSTCLAEMDGDRIRRMIDVNATGAL